MQEIEKVVAAALQQQLTARGYGPGTIARHQPQAVLSRWGKDFLIGRLRWRDAAGQPVEGPELEVSLSRPQGNERLANDFVRALLGGFPVAPGPEPEQALAAPPEPAPAVRPQPAFLIGAPRSGTTWIQRILRSHPAICGGPETHFFTLFGNAMALADRMSKQNPRRVIGPLAYVSRDTFEESLRRLWNEIFAGLYADHPDARVHLEKTPFHTLTLPEIHRLFPQAPIILLLRDSRAVASSLMQAGRGWGKYWAPATAREAAIEWYRHVDAALAWHKAHPEHPFLVIRYEEALADPQAALTRMLDFLLPPGVPHDLAATFAAYEAEEATRKDPEGFARLRGHAGWRSDMTLFEKIVVWRYTRKKMKEIGYGTITPFR